MGKIIFFSLMIIFTLFGKYYSDNYFKQQDVNVYYEEIPMGYHEVKIAYETFPLVYKNDFNKDHKFVEDKQLDPNIKILLRVARILTTFN